MERFVEGMLRLGALLLLLGTGVALLFVLLHVGDYGLALLKHGRESSTKGLVESILDGFVLIELLRSFGDYLSSHRIHISLLLETVLVFVLREMASSLYLGHTGFGTMLGYSVLIPVLLVSRLIACRQDCESS